MKRISRTQLQKIDSFRISRFQKQLIRKQILAGKIERIPNRGKNVRAIRCPKQLSFSSNYQESIIFFQAIRDAALQFARWKESGFSKPPNISVRFGDLERVSIRCAIVVAAELDRLSQVTGHKIKYVGDPENEPEAISVLRQIGCFKLLGIDKSKANSAVEKSNRVLIPLMSGLSCDDKKFEEFEKAVQQICSGYRTLAVVHEGMAEAMLNVVHHAYIDIKGFPFTFPIAGKRWWATACHDSENHELKILIFDQGHGIPRTLPYSGFKELISASMVGATHGSLSGDATLLVSALEYARTRTNESGRGKGFQDITDSVDKMDGSKLRIMSVAPK